MDRRHFLLALPLTLWPLHRAVAAPPRLVFDGGKAGEPLQALHGVNGGPLAAGGLLDLSPRWKEAAFPLARLHDCHWPNPDVVDVHAVFPNASADPEKAESYDFERTDEYLKAIIDTGAKVVYRLGESIEHQKVKRHARPPHDPQKWAQICVGIVRHYTEGWAKGFTYPIAYWEIWNEPDNRPSCWTGTDNDYLKLYSATASALRARFPKLQIGGPGIGNTGQLGRDGLEPPPFLQAFLAHCRKEKLPLDFFSWHCYSGTPTEFVLRAKGVRTLLDAAGFKTCASHLNEWNYLPDNDWSGMMAREARVRQKWHDRVTGAEGAAFVAVTLALLHDAPVDAACYFTAEPQGIGLFSPHGLPTHPFHVLRAYRGLVGRHRLPLQGELPPGVAALAGIAPDRESVLVLVARYASALATVSLEFQPIPWSEPTHYEIVAVTDRTEWERVTSGTLEGGKLPLELPASSVRLVRLTKAKK